MLVPRFMIRRLLSAAVVLLLASSAQASPINLLLTTDHYWPTIGAPEISFQFEFIESPTNNWMVHARPSPTVLAGGFGAGPGVTQFNVSLDVASLDNVYFKGWGDYFSDVEGPFWSQYSAQPPTGPVEDRFVHTFGPPWIPLANLGDGFSGDFRYFFGYSRGPIGTWNLTVAPAQPTPVPEPASVLLLGSGLAAVAARKYRRQKPKTGRRIA